MKKVFLPILILMLTNFSLSAGVDGYFVSASCITSVKNSLVRNSTFSAKQVERGVAQAAQLWTAEDGTQEEFVAFCQKYFCKDKQEKEQLFNRIVSNLEVIFGHDNRVAIDLLRPLHVTGYESTKVDEIFATYSTSAHFNEDMFKNKIAFVIVLNFPSFTLKEKQLNGQNWSELEWGYVRLGDMFDSRVNAAHQQRITDATSAADNYISNYNIPMGMLLGDGFTHPWSSDLKLISHWGLRDELKACYSDPIHGLAKQELIYHTMRHIIYQDIPTEVLENNTRYGWFPPSNKLYLSKIEVDMHHPGPNKRYEVLLDVFKAMKEADASYPNNPTYISRKFDKEYEISMEETQALFNELLLSPQVKEVAKLISNRLGRKLQPFDIWYDGFKSRSSISQEELDRVTLSRYPNKEAFEKDLANIMRKLEFSQSTIDMVCSHITVDASVGAGHAWGATMKSDNSMLRTRIGENGMDYKGYNIGVHEFGHNVEQTISLHNVPNYMLAGVPNTAFTEALAFLFQARDLELLGVTTPDANTEYLNTLDIFWGCYEIMGGSMVDMKVWEWMYANPNADAYQLKDAVINIAKEVWNTYYAPVFGVKDQAILAIYSHMIDAPLYLSAYPLGHIIHFQLENYMKGKSLGKEAERMFAIGRVTPNLWMQRAVGAELSVKPLLAETTVAAEKIKIADAQQKRELQRKKRR